MQEHVSAIQLLSVDAVNRSCLFRTFCTGGDEDDEASDSGLFLMHFFREYWPEFIDDYRVKVTTRQTSRIGLTKKRLLN